MEDSEKGKNLIALGPLTFFKLIHSSKAYRMINLFDVVLMLFNSHFLGSMLYFVSTSITIQAFVILLCQAIMV